MNQKNLIEISVDGRDLNYEKERKFYFFRLMAMWILTFWVGFKKMFFGKKLKINTFWFDGMSEVCREVKEGAFSWRALDVIYNFVPLKGKSLRARITNYWDKLLNTQAVRNRFRLAKNLLEQTIRELAKKEKEIRILSIASGSARAVVETISGLKGELEKLGVTVRIMLLDLDPSAIEYSRQLAEGAGISEGTVFVNKSTTFLEEVAKDFRPQVVEMVGFLEYRPGDKATNLLQRINRVLAPGGTLLVSQITSNPEKFFLAKVVNWPMVYRSPVQFSKIIIKAGFDRGACKIIYEPLEIHGIGICQKSLNKEI